ncbi:unnamed protein product [Owenia fusiformis]|uniref:Uncharacterized protein n=1 Tax=Owenia fusiformis TaxID=6347 RepID=A0A8J1XFW4_OWEFU|nr:unnamed protein product [Owenia fusiformis]
MHSAIGNTKMLNFSTTVLINASDLERDVSVNYSATTPEPRLILGLPVNLFAYICLGISGAAPVIFIIIVVITMKCYSMYKKRKRQRYNTRFRSAREMWLADKEKSPEHERTRNEKLVGFDNTTFTDDNEAMPNLQEGNTVKSDDSLVNMDNQLPESQVLQVYSENNPDVYFQDATLSRTNTNTDSPKIQTTNFNCNPPSIEEAQAIVVECFDKVYRDLDDDMNNSSDTDSGRVSLGNTVKSDRLYMYMASEQSTVYGKGVHADRRERGQDGMIKPEYHEGDEEENEPLHCIEREAASS